MTFRYPPGNLPIQEAYSRFREWYWSRWPALQDDGGPNWQERERRESESQHAFLSPFLDRQLSMKVFVPEQRAEFEIDASQLGTCTWPERLLASAMVQSFPGDPLTDYAGLAHYVDRAAFEDWFARQSATHSLDQFNEPAEKRKAGRKPKVDWVVVERKVHCLMDENGDFEVSDADWNCQACLEEAILDFCELRLGVSLDDTTVRKRQ
jgi:hypothetical protein